MTGSKNGKLEISAILVEVLCPVCESGGHQILKPSSYTYGTTVAELEAAYRASSDHALLDQVVRCRQCGMVYINPRLATEVILSGYESVEDPLFIEQNPERIRTFERTLRSVLSRSGIEPAGKRLLDVGCAAGAFLVAARNAGFDVTGVEPSRWLSGYGRKTYDLDIRQGILRPETFPEGSFDVITIWDVIEHVPDPHALLQTVHSLLKPNGFLWINFPDIDSSAAKLLGWKWPFWLSVHLHYYTPATIRRQIERAGFDVLFTRLHWQGLQLGYILRRASGVAPIFKPFQSLVGHLGLSRAFVLYNIGQTLAVARRAG
jgi:SAM-dependent methyltransferase